MDNGGQNGGKWRLVCCELIIEWMQQGLKERMNGQPLSPSKLLILKYEPRVNVSQAIKIEQGQGVGKSSVAVKPEKVYKYMKNRQFSTFYLPVNMNDYTNFKNKIDLEYLLKKQFNKAKKLEQYYYNVYTCKNQQFLYAQCKKCNSCLRYKWRCNTFQLHLFKNLHEHQHEPKKYSTNSQSNTNPTHNQPKHPSKPSPLYDGFTMLQQLTKEGFQAILNQLKDKAQIDYELEYPKNYDTTLPSTLVIMTKSMKESYRKYGECVRLDLIQNVIKSESRLIEAQLTNLDYTLGILSGLKNGDSFIIFGVIIVSSNNTIAYNDCFRKFIQLVGQSPKSIITEKKVSIMIGLQDLKSEGVFEGQHLWNPTNIWKAYAFRNATIKDILKEMVSAQSKEEYQRLLNKALSVAIGNDDRQKIQIFHESSKKYCFSQIDCFVGFKMLRVGSSSKIQNFITNRFPYPKQYTSLIPKLLELCDTRNIQKQSFVRQNSVVEEILGIPIIYQWRNQLPKNYMCILQLTIQEVGQRQYTVMRGTDIYKVVYISKKWKCTCDYEMKTKMICQHIIKVLVHKNNPILDEIDEYWKQGVLDDKNLPREESQGSLQE